VRALVLHGVRHVDEGDLRRHLVTEETAHVVWADKKPFDPFALRLDAATIEAYYRAHGYYDARVTATDVNPADKPNAVNVEVFVDEGAATKIERVDVSGLDVIGDDAKPVFRNLDLRKGQIFDHARYEAEKGEMRQRMRTLGYAWADEIGDAMWAKSAHKDAAWAWMKFLSGAQWGAVAAKQYSIAPPVASVWTQVGLDKDPLLSQFYATHTSSFRLPSYERSQFYFSCAAAFDTAYSKALRTGQAVGPMLDDAARQGQTCIDKDYSQIAK